MTNEKQIFPPYGTGHADRTCGSPANGSHLHPFWQLSHHADADPHCGVVGALYGVASGALIGTVFGLVVLVMVLTGADASGQMMLALHPLITSVACVVKGTLCGAASAAVYQLLARRSGKAAVVAAAAVCPLVNTGVLYLVLVLFFDTSWAAVLSAFMSVNFLLELAVNIVLAPAVLRIVTMRRRTA